MKFPSILNIEASNIVVLFSETACLWALRHSPLSALLNYLISCAISWGWGDRGRLRRFPLNVRAVSAKIKLPKKYLQHCHILRTDKKNLSLLLLPSWPRERKLDLKLSIFQLKRRFMSVQNKMAPVFSILLRDLKLIFLRMLENFIAGSLGQVN